MRSRTGGGRLASKASVTGQSGSDHALVASAPPMRAPTPGSMRTFLRLAIFVVLALAVQASGAGASPGEPGHAGARSTRIAAARSHPRAGHARAHHGRRAANASSRPAVPAPARPVPQRHRAAGGARVHHRTPREDARFAVLASIQAPRDERGMGLLMRDLNLSHDEPMELRESERGPPRASPTSTHPLGTLACAHLSAARASAPAPTPRPIVAERTPAALPAPRRSRVSLVRPPFPRRCGTRRAALSPVRPGRTPAVRPGGAAAGVPVPPSGGIR